MKDPNSFSEQPSVANDGVQSLAQMPSFAEHMSAKNENLSPEDLKETSKMLKQIEQMGARPEIVNNSAFRHMLEERIGDYGLKMSTSVEADTKGDSLLMTFSCKDKTGGSWCHDRGNMDIFVEQDGSVTINCACADKKSGSSMSKPAGYNGPTFGNGSIDGTELTNLASITKFNLLQDGNLQSIEQSAYESQLAPTYGEDKDRFSVYYGGCSETIRTYDTNGVEQHREDIEYEGRELEGHDFLSAHMDIRSVDEKPKRASFNLLRSLRSDFTKDIKHRASYDRNSDGTMHVRDYKDGEMVEIERCPMNTQYGTSELIPGNGAIETARDAKRREGK